MPAPWFQSVRNIKEKKFEVLFQYKKELYSKLHKLTFASAEFGQARYRWQIDGDLRSKGIFIKEFQKWFEELREFYETSSWAIDSSVYTRLDSLYGVASEIDNRFWRAEYEDIDSEPEEIDELWFRLLEAGKTMRSSIQNTIRG